MDSIAVVGPTWAWIASALTLVAFGGLCVGLLTWALGLRVMLNRQAKYHDRAAKVDEVDNIAKSLSGRITVLERAKRPAPLSQLPKVWDGADDEQTAKTVVSAQPART